jgi:alkylation response protein AidB-like acyl-CoA dehydrogenase
MTLTKRSAIRDAVRSFAQDRIAPKARAFEEARAYPPALFEDLAELGLMGMTAPESVGGAGADYVSYALALIEIAAADGALSTILSIQNSLIVSGLLNDGTPQQALSRELNLVARRLESPVRTQAAVAARHVWMASSRKTRSVRRDVRWRWTLKVFWTAV